VTLCLLGAKIADRVVIAQQNLLESTSYRWFKNSEANPIHYPNATVGNVDFLQDITDGFSDRDLIDIFFMANLQTSHYQYKFGGLSTTDCSTELGYSDFIPVDQRLPLHVPGNIDEPLVLCILGGGVNADACGCTWYQQPLSNPSRYQWQASDVGAFQILAPSGTITDATPIIKWEPSANAVTYDLTIARNDDCSDPVYDINDLTVNSWQIPAPLAEGVYHSCLAAKGVEGTTKGADNNGQSFVIAFQTPSARHILFATSALAMVDGSPAFPPVYPGFGHLDAADWICTFRASEANLIEDWDHNALIYRAVISIVAVNAIERVVSDEPVFNTRGDMLAQTPADLFVGDLMAPVGFDEFGASLESPFRVWTGSSGNGAWSGTSCQNWDNPDAMATVGDVRASSTMWLEKEELACSASARLYCISPIIHP